MASAAQPTAINQRILVPTDSRHTGCHSVMFLRDNRTVSAMNSHNRPPYGFASVATAHATPSAREIDAGGRLSILQAISTSDHRPSTPAPTTQPP